MPVIGVLALSSFSEAGSHEMAHSPRLIIVCGLPGAGKTTHSKRLALRLDAFRFAPDEWMESLGIDLWDESARSRIEVMQWDLGKQLIGHGLTVIIEWGTWARSERDTLRGEARRLGAAVELHYLWEPIDVLWERLASKNAELPPIQRSDLEKWAASFEPPDLDELALYDSPTQE